MAQECERCGREFLGIESYPSVNLLSFVRVEVPSSVAFTGRYEGEFFGDTPDLPRAPKPVVEHLSGIAGDFPAEHIVYKGNVWRIDRRKSEHDKPGDYEGPIFRCWVDRREEVISSTEPHLIKLEGLVGKEMPPRELLPSSREQERNLYYIVPGYFLSFRERETSPDVDVNGELNRFFKEVAPSLATANGLRVAAISVTHFYGGLLPGTIGVEIVNAVVGGIAYEGRLKGHWTPRIPLDERVR